ncbi:hypothetical protein GCM10029964_123520 [Kibdelosporangium lantanae]
MANANHTGTHPRLPAGPMPPPMAPPGTGSFPQPPRRRSGRAWLWVVLVVILVALVVLAVWAIPKMGSGNRAPGTPTAVTTSSSYATPGRTGLSLPDDSPTYGETRLGPVQVRPTDLLGHPADQVAERLRKSGLEPDVHPESNGAPQDLRTCLVTGVQPIGTLDPGSKVTVECAPGGQPPG